MFYSGESNVPGAPGNLFAGGNFMGGAGSVINPEALKRDARQQKIYNKGVRTDNPSEKEIFLQRTGPQLPFAYQGGTSSPTMAFVGNAAGMANAEFFRGPQFDEIAMEPPYTPRERAEDQLLLRSLQKGEMGSGPLIDKAIKDLIQRTSMGGTGLRGV
jgi:hypothetical protein